MLKFLPFFLLLFACQSQSKQLPVDSPAESRDTVSLSAENSGASETGEAPDEEGGMGASDDCVFDTSAFKFTTEALKHYDSRLRYTWDRGTKAATVVLPGNDTLILHIGGCYHFGYSAELHTKIPYSDEAALTAKVRWMAKSFFGNGFDEKYAECIDRKQYEEVEAPQPGMQSFMLTGLVPEEEESNSVCEGFWFRQNGSRTIVAVSGYLD